MKELNEHRMSKPVAEWLRSQGYQVHAEVPVPHSAGKADFVGVRDDEVCAVELKVSFSSALLHQCLRDSIRTDRVYAAASTFPKPSTLDRFATRGIGMLFVKEGSVEILNAAPRSSDTVDHYTLKVRMHCERMGPSDNAGKPCIKGVCPAQDCERAVAEYRARHPDATWLETFMNVPNHYASHHSLRSSMKLVRFRQELARNAELKKNACSTARGGV
jgi:hypothetical protein